MYRSIIHHSNELKKKAKYFNATTLSFGKFNNTIITGIPFHFVERLYERLNSAQEIDQLLDKMFTYIRQNNERIAINYTAGHEIRIATSMHEIILKLSVSVRNRNDEHGGANLLITPMTVIDPPRRQKLIIK